MAFDVAADHRSRSDGELSNRSQPAPIYVKQALYRLTQNQAYGQSRRCSLRVCYVRSCLVLHEAIITNPRGDYESGCHRDARNPSGFRLNELFGDRELNPEMRGYSLHSGVIPPNYTRECSAGGLVAFASASSRAHCNKTHRAVLRARARYRFRYRFRNIPTLDQAYRVTGP